MRKFYYEYDDSDGEWLVMEEGGTSSKQSGFYNTPMFSCTSKQDAIDAIELLIELQGGAE